jgi:hypothetical protein
LTDARNGGDDVSVLATTSASRTLRGGLVVLVALALCQVTDIDH